MDIMTLSPPHVAPQFSAYHGDNVEIIRGFPEGSIDLTVSSPPFPAMYVYSNSPRDIGNTGGIGEMLDHFRFLAREILRVTKGGRSCCVHLTNINAFLHRDGYIGRFDFRGDVIRLFQQEGWIYASEVLIDKCPQMRRARTNDRGLLFKSLATDSAVLAPVMADYLVVFRKPGINPDPIRAGISTRYKSSGWVTEEEWIKLAAAAWHPVEMGWVTEDMAFDTARGVWYRRTPERDHGKSREDRGIEETDVLNSFRHARDADDERHLCPLQLGVIRNCVKLWSAPGEIVFDPFGGIFSTPHEAIRLGRKGIAIELKQSYYDQGVRNCTRAAAEASRQDAMLPCFAELDAEGVLA